MAASGAVKSVVDVRDGLGVGAVEISAGTGPRIAKGLPLFAWWVVGYNVLVILWGAVVRATG
jgi:cytochrome c oxidase assembly protein subunit 15